MNLRESTDLAGERLRGYVLAASDESVASRANLLKSEPANPKSGWVTRRRRDDDHDWAIVRLGVPGTIEEIVVDTTHFAGNYPPEVSLEGCVAPHNAHQDELTEWTEIVCRSTLNGDTENSFKVHHPYRFTHIRLNIYPDGGVARLRVYGRPVPNWMAPGFRHATGLDLAAAVNGGHVYAASNMQYGDRQNLIMPIEPDTRSDVWGTRRRREAGHDWAVVRLVGPGEVRAVTLDSAHVTHECPGKASLEASCASDPGEDDWFELLPPQAMLPHTEHQFSEELAGNSEVLWVRLNLFPDGGMARLRVWGELADHGLQEARLLYLNSSDPSKLRELFKQVCHSDVWVENMLSASPFSSVSDFLEKGSSSWAPCTEKDWIQALDGHPRIGQKAKGSDLASKWSRGEQSAAKSDEDVRARLLEAQERYYEKFGFIFLICASGRGSEEILRAVEERLPRSKVQELQTVAEEQAKIIRLRLEKLLKS